MVVGLDVRGKIGGEVLVELVLLEEGRAFVMLTSESEREEAVVVLANKPGIELPLIS